MLPQLKAASANAATVRYVGTITAPSKPKGRLEQPKPGVLIWHTPAGRSYATGTQHVPRLIPAAGDTDSSTGLPRVTPGPSP